MSNEQATLTVQTVLRGLEEIARERCGEPEISSVSITRRPTRDGNPAYMVVVRSTMRAHVESDWTR